MWFKYNKRKSSESYNKRLWADIFTYIIHKEKMDAMFVFLFSFFFFFFFLIEKKIIIHSYLVSRVNNLAGYNLPDSYLGIPLSIFTTNITLGNKNIKKIHRLCLYYSWSYTIKNLSDLYLAGNYMMWNMTVKLPCIRPYFSYSVLCY